jgi:signal transduction histidine kinase
MHVLLVGEDQTYADVVTRQLAASAPQVTLARERTLQGACERLTRNVTDVVLLDLALADTSVFDALDRIRRAAPKVPIVVVSDVERIAAEAVQRGAEDYLIKAETTAPLLTRALRYARERAEFCRALQDTEEQLRQAHKMEAVGRLAGGIAHDFNNVLTAIFGYADLLLDQLTDDDPRRADVQEIRRSADRAAALTRQLLAFSRKQPMAPHEIDVQDVVRSLEKLLARLVGEDITLRIGSAGPLWRIRADSGQIEQVLMNLCANARDAMPEGGTLTVFTENYEVAAEAGEHPGLHRGKYVRLTVTDTGYGMPADVQRHLFEPFFTTKEQGRGTGLGLATVYGIVRQAGGLVYVESQPGSGTRFVIYLPSVDAVAP